MTMARKRAGRRIDGWLVLDKPSRMTSTAAVAAVKRLTGAAKLGHVGTLDPLATGVLPIAFGEATKTVAYAMAAAKRYRFGVRWGKARDTDDADGAVTETSDARPAEAVVVQPAEVDPLFEVDAGMARCRNGTIPVIVRLNLVRRDDLRI